MFTKIVMENIRRGVAEGNLIGRDFGDSQKTKGKKEKRMDTVDVSW